MDRTLRFVRGEGERFAHEVDEAQMERRVYFVEAAARALRNVVERTGRVEIVLPRRTYLPFLWALFHDANGECTYQPLVEFVGVVIRVDEET